MKMTAYHLLLLLCPLALLGALPRSRFAQWAVAVAAVAAVVSFSGFRWYADVDYEGYALLFADTPLLDRFSPETVSDLYGEPGYLLLSSILRSSGLGFFTLALLCAIFSIGVKAFVASQFVRSAGVVLFLYLCIHFVTIEFIQIRWAVASALIALSFVYLHRAWNGVALLCLALACSFHYFSFAFVAIAALMFVRREAHLYWLLAGIGILAGLIAWRGFELPLGLEAEAYILQRALRYITDSLSTIGVMSYVKVSIYPLAYLVLTAGRPSLHVNSTTSFLRRLSISCVAFTLALSVVPVMHHRMVVLADLFSLMLLVRVIELRFSAVERLALFAVLSVPYATWFVLDINANFSAGTLYEFRTWIPSLF